MLYYDRQSVGQSVLVSGTHLGPATNFSFSLKFSLWREGGSVIYCTIASGPCLGSKSRRTHGHILLSHLRLPQPRGPGSRIYVPREQGGPVIPPITVFPFRRLSRLAGLQWRYSNPPAHGNILHKSKSKSHYDVQSVGQSVLVSGAHLGTLTNFSFSLRFSF
jgi:hypothetical protein